MSGLSRVACISIRFCVLLKYVLNEMFYKIKMPYVKIRGKLVRGKRGSLYVSFVYSSYEKVNSDSISPKLGTSTGLVFSSPRE